MQCISNPPVNRHCVCVHVSSPCFWCKNCINKYFNINFNSGFYFLLSLPHTVHNENKKLWTIFKCDFSMLYTFVWALRLRIKKLFVIHWIAFSASSFVLLLLFRRERVAKKGRREGFGDSYFYECGYMNAFGFFFWRVGEVFVCWEFSLWIYIGTFFSVGMTFGFWDGVGEGKIEGVFADRL